MNRFTNKHHRDLQHPTKKEIDDMENKRTVEQIEKDLKNLEHKHDATVATLHYINTEIRLLEAELKVMLDKKEASPIEDINACAKMLGITE